MNSTKVLHTPVMVVHLGRATTLPSMTVSVLPSPRDETFFLTKDGRGL